MKTNKNGVKLLTAIMAFAIVLAAGFIVFNDNEESDAITSSSVYELGTPVEGVVSITVTEAKEYYVKDDSVVSISGTPGSSTVTKFYVLSGKTLEVRSTGNANVVVNVYMVTQAPATNGTAIPAEKIANVDASFSGTHTFTFTGLAEANSTEGTNGEGYITITGSTGVTTTNISTSAWVVKCYDDGQERMDIYSVGKIPSNIGYSSEHEAIGYVVFNVNIAGINTIISNTNGTVENQFKLTDAKITSASTSLKATLAVNGDITLEAGAEGGAEIQAGVFEVSKGTIKVHASNGMKFTLDHFIGVSQGAIGAEQNTAVTAGLVLSNKVMSDSAYVYGVAIKDTEVRVSSQKILSFQQGSSFNGKVYGLLTNGTSVGMIDMSVSGDTAQRHVTLTVGDNDGIITVTAAKTLKTLTSGASTYVVGSEFIIKDVTNTGVAIGTAASNDSSFELADNFSMTPSASNSDWSFGSNYWSIIVQKDSTIDLLKHAEASTNGYAQINVGANGKVYIFGDVNIAKEGSNTITANKIYYTKNNEVAVKAAGAANEALAQVTAVENNAFYVLSKTQALGYDITNAAITFKSGTSGTSAFNVYTTTDGTDTTSKIVKEINLSGFKGTIDAQNSSSASIPAIINVCAGTSFTISDETVLRTSSAGISLVLLDGSELVIKDSNILMEVTKNTRADVKVSAKTMELTNPSGNIEVGYMREAIVSGDINGSSVTVYGNMTIAGTAKISSGSTVNVYKGGNLSVEGSLTVEGTVNFNNGSSGSISGTMTIGMPNAGASVNVIRSNVTVTETGTVKVIAPNAKGISEGRTNTLDISASVAPIYNEPASGTVTPNPDGKLDNTPYMFTVLGTLNMNGTLKADNIYDMGTITINGTVSNSTARNAAEAGEAVSSGTSKITVFDGVSITLTSVTGTLDVTDSGIMAEAERPLAKLASGNTVNVQNVRGVTVSEAVAAESYTSGSNTYRVYVSYMTVSGTFSEATESGIRQVTLGGSAAGPTGSSINGGILITDDVIVGKNVKLSSSAKVKMSGTITVVADQAELSLTGGMMTVTGTITVKNGNQLANEVSSGSEAYIAAAKSYVLDAATAVYTYTYTTFENAISTVLSAENKTVDVLGTVTVSESTDIPAEAVVEISGKLVIGKNATVVAKERSSINGAQISVSGSFTSEDYINDLDVDKIDADVVSTKDVSRTWTSLAKAIDGATEGSVITTSKAVEVGNLTIPAGVTVTTEYNITVKKNSIIAVDGTLTVNKGTIIQNDATGADVKGSIVIGENGVVSVVDAAPDIFIDVAGAHFQKLIGAKDYFFVTNVAYAAANADSKIVGGNIDIYGEVAMGDITFTKAADADSLNIRLKKTTDTDLLTAVSGNISLVNGTTFSAEEKVVFSGTVSVDSLATMAFQKAEGVSIVKYIDNSASTPVEYALINTNSAKGSLVFESGTAYIGTGALATGSIVTNSNFDVTVGAEAKLVVPQNGTVTVGTSAKADKSTFIVEGTLDVVKGKVTVNSNGIMDVLGTVNISETPTNTKGVFVDGIMNVLGTVTVSDESTKTGYLKVNGIIAVGSKPTDLGASGAIDGTVVTGTATGYVKIYSGEVGAVKVDTLDAEPTVVTINGEKYMTLLGKGDVRSILVVEDIDLEGLKGYVSGTTKIYSDEAMTQEIIGSFNIGYYDAIYFELDTAQVDLYVSVGTALTLWIDGERYLNNTSGSYKLDVGTHDVKVIIDPNYQGTTTITFNGQTITNGKIVVTTDMIGERNVLSATGDLTIIPGEEPAPVEPTKDDGMGITEYLLIVLVVLAAILVVVVAIRMMRS